MTKGITVRELIQALKKLPQDMETFVQGCDCVGECSGAKYVPDDRCVLVTRHP